MTATELVSEARNEYGSRGALLSDNNQMGQALMVLLDLVLNSINYELKPNTTPTVVARALAILIVDVEHLEGPAKTPLHVVE